MAFVHSLVKAEINKKLGWCAPVELGEAAPHYVSFASRWMTLEAFSTNTSARQLLRRTEQSESIPTSLLGVEKTHSCCAFTTSTCGSFSEQPPGINAYLTLANWATRIFVSS